LEGLFKFMENNSIYIVLFIVLVVWTGIFSYLVTIDKKVKLVEKEFQKENQYER